MGKLHLLKDCDEEKDKQTLNLEVFVYQNFLDFLEWTVNHRTTLTGSTLSGYRSAMKSFYKDKNMQPPQGFDLDMRDVFSGKNTYKVKI